MLYNIIINNDKLTCMFFDRISRVWVVDQVDYLLLSALGGSLLASYLKDYLTEKKAMERLKKSIIKKSKLLNKSERTIFTSKKARIKKIYKFAVESVALKNRGGQIENLNPEDSKKLFKLALEIQGFVQRRASFFKETELKRVARILFKNGKLILELILCKCKIDITYALLNEKLSTQVIVVTAAVVGTAGFIVYWFSVGASLVAPPLLISIF